MAVSGEQVVTPRPGAARPIDASSLAVPEGATIRRAERPLPTPAIQPHVEPTRPAVQPAAPAAWESIERDRLPIEIRDVYDAVATERTRLATETEARQKAWEAERATMQQQLSQQNEDYQRVLAALMQTGAGQGDRGAEPALATARAGARPASSGQAEPEIDWYDPRQVYALYDKRLNEQNAAWATYADEVNAYWQKYVGQAQGYAVAAARLMATDTEFAKDPKLVAALFTEASKYNGDIDKAYQAIKAPLVERAKLQGELETLRKQVEDYKKQAPAMLGQLAPLGPKPLKPIVGARPAMMGSTGRYHEILGRYQPSQFYSAEEEMHPSAESVAAF